jgi:hypothetical protein
MRSILIVLGFIFLVFWGIGFAMKLLGAGIHLFIGIAVIFFLVSLFSKGGRSGAN